MNCYVLINKIFKNILLVLNSTLIPTQIPYLNTYLYYPVNNTPAPITNKGTIFVNVFNVTENWNLFILSYRVPLKRYVKLWVTLCGYDLMIDIPIFVKGSGVENTVRDTMVGLKHNTAKVYNEPNSLAIKPSKMILW